MHNACWFWNSAGLNLLLEMLQSFQHSDFATQFHKTYYLNLMQEVFAVMTGQPYLPSIQSPSNPVLHIGSAACQLPLLFSFKVSLC